VGMNTLHNQFHELNGQTRLVQQEWTVIQSSLQKTIHYPKCAKLIDANYRK
jgi:hypothetical protein